MLKQLLTPSYIKNSLQTYVHYLRNPIQGIQELPDWSWPELLFQIAGVTAVTGCAAGLVQTSFASTVYGLIMIPVISIILILIGAGFFYYFFQIFAGQSLSMRKMVTVLFFANIPFFLFQIASEFFPPISLIGLAFTGFILIAGLTTQFGLPRRLVARSVILVYFLFMMVWAWSRLDAIRFERSMNESLRAPPVQLGE